MKKAIIATTALLAIIVAAVAAGGYYILKGAQFSLNETAYIHIYPTDSAADIMKLIEETAHPHTMLGFCLLAHHNNLDKQKRSGDKGFHFFPSFRKKAILSPSSTVITNTSSTAHPRLRHSFLSQF